MRAALERGGDVRRGPPGPDDILTCRQVATWLQLTVRQVQRLGIPYLALGTKNRRYLGRDVLAWLEQQRRLDARVTLTHR